MKILTLFLLKEPLRFKSCPTNHEVQSRSHSSGDTVGGWTCVWECLVAAATSEVNSVTSVPLLRVSVTGCVYCMFKHVKSSDNNVKSGLPPLLQKIVPYIHVNNMD